MPPGSPRRPSLAEREGRFRVLVRPRPSRGPVRWNAATGVGSACRRSSRSASLAPFVEFRYEILGGEQWVITGGILFG